MTNPAWSPWMREKTAAPYLDKSKSWLRNTRHQDKRRVEQGLEPLGPPHHFDGRTIYFIRDELDDWMRKRLKTPVGGNTKAEQNQQSSGPREIIRSGAPAGAQEVGRETP